MNIIEVCGGGAILINLKKYSVRGKSILWVVILAAGSVVSCGGSPVDENGGELSVLRVGVLPDESTEALHQKYDPLLAVLADYIGIPCELVIRDSYDALVDTIVRGQVDLAHLGGYSYILAHEQAGVDALVQRYLDTRFTSYLIARDEDWKKKR